MIILNGNQAREYNRSQTLETYLTGQNSVYSLYPPFSQEAELFLNNKQQLAKYIPVKNTTGTGITVEKTGLKTTVADLGNIICTRTTAYAMKIKDSNLLAAVAYRTTEIRELKDGDILGFATQLTGTVAPLLANPAFKDYAVTQEMLTELTDEATAFNNNIGKAAIVNGNRSYASKAINALFKAIRANVVQFNLLVDFFAKDNPDFVEGYHKAAAINNTGRRHNGVEGMARNSFTGQPIAGVTITGEGKNKTAVTDSTGTYKLMKIKTGTQKLTIAAPGYDSQEMTVTIARGKILALNLVLQAKTIAIATA